MLYIANVDFTSNAQVLVFAPVIPSITIQVSIIADSIDERDEYFSLLLSSSAAGVEVNPSVANVTSKFEYNFG